MAPLCYKLGFSFFSANWKSEIDANGELFYIESQAFEEITNEGLNNRKCQVLKEDSTCKNTGNSRKGGLNYAYGAFYETYLPFFLY